MYCNQNVYSSNPIQKTIRWFQVGNDFNTKKEVKKVNKIPYFELKVVKVKKEKNKCEHPFRTWESGLFYPKFKCTKCGEFVIPPFKMEEGNWVNGENLDKIKFPCFCRWDYGKGSKKYLGMINCTYHKDSCWQIIGIEEQKTEENVCRQADTLKELIEQHNVKILKGKITIFEEEE